MNFILFLEFVFIFNTIKGNESPFVTIPREQELSQQLMPKTIIISGKNGQFNTEDPNIMQAVMNAVNNQYKNNANNQKEVDANRIPEVIITDSGSEKMYPEMSSPFESVQKVYNFPPMFRMISSEEEETDDKNSPLWRSPLPLLHPMGCPHHRNGQKSKTGHKKVPKQSKTVKLMPSPSLTPSLTPSLAPSHKPISEDIEKREPMTSMLTSIIANSVFHPMKEQERQVPDMRAPASFLMSISHRIRPEPEIPIAPMQRPHGFIAILHKRHEPLPVPEPKPQSMAPMSAPMPTFNPFLELLSKLEPFGDKADSIKDFEPKTVSPEREQKPNYNFNVNLTINNYNYPQQQQQYPKSEAMPPFPLGF